MTMTRDEILRDRVSEDCIDCGAGTVNRCRGCDRPCCEDCRCDCEDER